MFLRGTTNRTKSDIAQTIENMGGRFLSKTDRENTQISLQVFKGDVGKAVKLLGDVVTNSTINSNEFELVKEEVAQEHDDNHNRYMETTIENCHFNVYREHMMGQPIKGDRDNIQQISVDNLRDFHTTQYFGDNIVVVGAGNINHDEFVA
jgi:predicted Zn-dependent peptidase